MTELPSGTVTFLFSDIEGSTQHWERDPEGMARSLADHDEIFRNAIADHQGQVVKTTGDGVHAVFADAGDAVAGAIAAQLAMDRAAVDAEPLLVRIGLHTGSAELREGDYYGPALNRAARIMAAGHGGQILCSQATADLVRDLPTSGASLADLGEHHLRDLGRPERIYQVGHPDLADSFPPLRSLDRYRTNLTAQASAFVGREAELQRVATALDESVIVTLTGVGGVGKTRLALQAAAEALPRFPGGVWVVELTTVGDPSELDEAVAAGLAIAAAPGRTVRSAVIEYLRDRDLFLVLDNCEHLVGAVAELVEALTDGCPRLRVLATSREGLAVTGERLLAVPPLGLPVGDSEADVAASDAGGLFVERAHAVSDSFRLDPTNAAVVASLARRLDGIPLAIELAAARVRSMAPADILGHLDQRFRLLTGGRRTALSRQQTLRGAIDWSYDLLDEPSRVLLRRLGVFVGTFDLDAIEQICCGEAIYALDAPDLVQGLVERSLLVADTTRAPARYRFLETIRDYALNRLEEADEREEYGRRHALHFVAFASKAGRGVRSPEEVRWSDRLEDDLENVRAAALWLVGANAVDPAMEMVLALCEFGTRLAAPLGAVAGDIAVMPGAAGHPLRPVALGSAAWHVHQRDGGEGEARTMAEQAVQLTADEPSVPRCRAFAALSGISALVGDPAFTLRVAHDWLDMAEVLGDRWEELQALCTLAGMEAATDRGILFAERAVALAQAFGIPTYLAFSRLGLGLALASRDLSQARVQLEEAQWAAVEARNAYAESVTTGALAVVYVALGEHALAARTSLAACELADRAGHLAATAAQVRTLAVALASAGATEVGLLLYAWATQHGVRAYAIAQWGGADVVVTEEFDGQSPGERDALRARAAALDLTQALSLAADVIANLEAPTDRDDPAAIEVSTPP